MTLYDLSIALSNLSHDPRVDGNTPVVLAYETDTPEETCPECGARIPADHDHETNAPTLCLYLSDNPRRIVLAAVKHEPALVR